MCAFVVIGLVFPYQPKRLASGSLQNDLFCVEWDVKPQLSQLPRSASDRDQIIYSTVRSESITSKTDRDHEANS